MYVWRNLAVIVADPEYSPGAQVWMLMDIGHGILANILSHGYTPFVPVIALSKTAFRKKT